jgi:photosystem II stability/assembly factor-like uncharacterized protein
VIRLTGNISPPMRTRYAAFALFASLTFLGAGCFSIGGKPAPATNDGGVYKSFTSGDAWAQKTAVASAGPPKSIAGVSIVTIVQDPQDANAVYIGTAENGLFYSYDGGESWQQTAAVSRGRVPSIVVDPKDKCTVYAAMENKLLRTTDCSRTWDIAYVDTRTDKRITAVVVDFFNPKVVYAATSAGDVLKSSDGASSWTSLRTFNDQVLKLLMNSADSRKLFVALKGNGVWSTDDAGANWKDLSPNYKQFNAAKEFTDMAVGVSDANVAVIASKYGLIRTGDGGTTWTSVPLLTPPGSTLIYSLAVDPKDVNVMYYGTSTTFYRTVDGGANWVPKKLPTTRSATALLVDRSNSTVLYMGVTKFK